MNQNKIISRIIYRTLEENEASRDDYLIVVKVIHDMELAAQNLQPEDYYNAVFQKRVSSFQTIGRIWRKIQECVPHLRGKDWEERQILSGQVSKDEATEKSRYYQPNLF